jgi:hypothetical protein
MEPKLRLASVVERCAISVEEKESMRNEKRLIGPDGLVKYLGGEVPRGTLDRWRFLGGGPPYHRVGKRVVYDLNDVDIWLDDHRRTSTSDPGSLVTS